MQLQIRIYRVDVEHDELTNAGHPADDPDRTGRCLVRKVNRNRMLGICKRTETSADDDEMRLAAFVYFVFYLLPLDFDIYFYSARIAYLVVCVCELLPPSGRASITGEGSFVNDNGTGRAFIYLSHIKCSRKGTKRTARQEEMAEKRKSVAPVANIEQPEL